MVRNYKRKTEDRWSKEDLLEALTYIKESKLKINDAARQYRISRATLYRQFKKFLQAGGKCDVNQFRTCGGNPILTKVEEDVLEKTIRDLREQGFTVTSSDIKRICFEYCDSNGIPNQFNQEKRMASDDWYYGFLKRHPDVRVGNGDNDNNTETVRLEFGNFPSGDGSPGAAGDSQLKPKKKKKKKAIKEEVDTSNVLIKSPTNSKASTVKAVAVKSRSPAKTNAAASSVEAAPATSTISSKRTPAKAIKSLKAKPVAKPKRAPAKSRKSPKKNDTNSEATTILIKQEKLVFEEQSDENEQEDEEDMEVDQEEDEDDEEAVGQRTSENPETDASSKAEEEEEDDQEQEEQEEEEEEEDDEQEHQEDGDENDDEEAEGQEGEEEEEGQDDQEEGTEEGEEQEEVEGDEDGEEQEETAEDEEEEEGDGDEEEEEDED